MKITINILLTFLLTTFLFLTYTKAQNVEIDQLFGNSHFLLEQMEDVVVVSMEKSPWEAFTLSLTNGNFIENSICNIQFKSFENIDIRVEFSNGNTNFV